MHQKTIKGLILASILLFGFESSAQNLQGKQGVQEPVLSYKSTIAPNGQIRCHTMEADSILRAKNPNMPTLHQEEMWLQQKIKERKQEQALNPNSKKATVITIPIIFHIFTDGSGAENVSATIVQNQLDQLNLDYRDMAGSSYSQSADTEIEFCLAQVDESGTPLSEPGINRVTSYGDGPFSSNDFDNTMKAATIWDPNNYFNVWVGDLTGGLLGYAQFPSSSGLAGMPSNGGNANTDGVVILYSSMGSVANPQGNAGSSYNKGRTLTHEAGHWFGLRHVWGDGGCGVDDFCDDTPLSDASNYGCPNTNSCTDPGSDPKDMVENYMDYTDDACMNTFTADQKTRIRTVMDVSPRRASLANSTACAGTSSTDDAGISGIIDPVGTICGSTINPTVTLRNYGSNTLTSVSILYNIDGGANSTYNWSGSLASGASVNVDLGTMSPSAGAHVLNVSTSSPNGVNDANSSNDSDSEAFDMALDGEIVKLTINTDCYGEETYWELFDASSTLIGSGGNSNVVIPPGGQQLGTQQGDANAYGVEVEIIETFCLTEGCYDFTLYDDWGDGMSAAGDPGCTVNGNWVIEDGSSVVLAQMSNPAFGPSDAANFCITDGTSGIEENGTDLVSIFPNPSSGLIQIISKESKLNTLTVYDATGRSVLIITDVKDTMVSIDLSEFSNGVYNFEIVTENSTIRERVIKK